MILSWLKLDINILNDNKIKIIRKYPDGDSLFVLWIGLLCLAMKSDNSGYIYITNGIPYSIDDLSNEFQIEKKTIEMGLNLFKNYKMIDFLDGNIIEILNFNKHQQLDKIEHLRKISRDSSQKYREKKKKLLLNDNNGDGHVIIRDATDKIRIDKIRIDKEDMENIYNKILKHWNLKNIIKHDINIFKNYFSISKINNLLNIYDINVILKAIDNYDIVLKDETCFFNYKWTLWDFLKRGINKFVDNVDPLNNFKKNNKKEKQENIEIKKYEYKNVNYEASL